MNRIVDVVIPTYRPGERLLHILERLEIQTVRPRCVHLINTEQSGLDALLEGCRRRLTGSDDGAAGGECIAEPAAAECFRPGDSAEGDSAAEDGAAEDGSRPAERPQRTAGSAEEALLVRFPFLEITHIRQEEFDHGGTRNRGFRLCEGADYVLTMTQDALPADETLIGRLLEAFGPEVSGTGGAIAVAYARQLPNADAPVEERLSRYFNYPEAPRIKSESDREELGIKTYYCSNVCALYRMDIWRSLGGFPEHAIFNEDMIYASGALKSGYRICYAAAAQVYHSHNYTARQQFHRNFDLGVSQAQNPQVFGGLSSEGEGVSYVKAVVRQMLAEGAALQVPGFAVRCAARLAGYRLGKAYERLPRTWVVHFSSNQRYWSR